MSVSRLWKTLIYEIFVTFQLIFIGTGAIIVNQKYTGTLGDFGIGICFGLAIYVGIMLFGRISNAHMNPAATLLLRACGKINSKIAAILIISQIIGAFIASFILYTISPMDSTLGSTAPNAGILNSWFIEFGLTTILLIAVCLVSNMKVPLVAFILGSIVFLEAWLAGPLTGASMNPIRSIAPAVVSGNTENLWIYITAPFTASGLVYGLNRTFKLDSIF
jgi:aquaporin NIP|tara:strand:- start:58410 stop:59069 length:660 start_codon:yes stop_codon:yes gene_type:complete